MKNIKLLLLLLSSQIFHSCTENSNHSNISETTEAHWEGCMLSAYIFQEDGRYYPNNALSLIESFESLSKHEIGSRNRFISLNHGKKKT